MSGLKSWMLWFGWFVHAFSVNIISVIAIVILMKIPFWSATYPPIEYCSCTVLTVFLLLYCAASIAFCFMLSSVFNSRKYFTFFDCLIVFTKFLLVGFIVFCIIIVTATIAMIFGILVWIISYLVPFFIVTEYDTMDWYRKIIFAVFPNIALQYGYAMISQYEIQRMV